MYSNCCMSYKYLPFQVHPLFPFSSSLCTHKYYMILRFTFYSLANPNCPNLFFDKKLKIFSNLFGHIVNKAYLCG